MPTLLISCFRYKVSGWRVVQDQRTQAVVYHIFFTRLPSELPLLPIINRPKAEELDDYQEYKRIRKEVRSNRNPLRHGTPFGPLGRRIEPTPIEATVEATTAKKQRKRSSLRLSIPMAVRTPKAVAEDGNPFFLPAVLRSPKATPKTTPKAVAEDGNPFFVPGALRSPKATPKSVTEDGNPFFLPKVLRTPKATPKAVAEDGNPFFLPMAVRTPKATPKAVSEDGNPFFSGTLDDTVTPNISIVRSDTLDFESMVDAGAAAGANIDPFLTGTLDTQAVKERRELRADTRVSSAPVLPSTGPGRSDSHGKTRRPSLFRKKSKS